MRTMLAALVFLMAAGTAIADAMGWSHVFIEWLRGKSVGKFYRKPTEYLREIDAFYALYPQCINEDFDSMLSGFALAWAPRNSRCLANCLRRYAPKAKRLFRGWLCNGIKAFQ
jgi:hypothetical protein